MAFVAPVPDPTIDASTGTDNVYVRDTCSGAAAGCVPATTLISVAADGISAADGASETPSISADGRYVTFVSLADNLAAGGASGSAIFFARYVHGRGGGLHSCDDADIRGGGWIDLKMGRAIRLRSARADATLYILGGHKFGDGRDVDVGRAANLFARSLRGRGGRLPGLHDSTIGIESIRVRGGCDDFEPVNAHTVVV